MIRLATAADRAAIERIVDAAYGIYVERIGKKPGPMLEDYAARIAAGQIWAAERDGGMAGVLVLIQAADHLLLDNVAVAPDRQGQGIGRALIAFAEAEARRRGCREVRLYTNAAMAENLAMYPRLGYRETGRGKQDGYDRVFFAKTPI